MDAGTEGPTPLNLSRLAHHPQGTTSQLGQLHRLGKTCVLGSQAAHPTSPPSHRSSTNANIGGWVGRWGGRSAKAQTPQTQISCFSLFTMSKTIKVQTNRCSRAPIGPNPDRPKPRWVDARAPKARKPKTLRRAPPRPKGVVGRGGLEPPTSRLSGVRSNHLSYRPSEPLGAQGRCQINTRQDPQPPPRAPWWSLPATPAGEAEDGQSQNPAGSAKEAQPNWWSLPGSNRRPSACKADALPTELRPRTGGRYRITEIRTAPAIPHE